jgi:histidine ammonia-lyase
MTAIALDGESLRLEEIARIAAGEACRVPAEAAARIEAAARYVERLVAEGRVVYGVTTGFGEFATVTISKDETAHLQRNLIMSHAAGVGEPLPEDVVRAAMALRINALAKGYSGLRLSTVQTLLAMLNAGIHPVVPAQGSVGASGDLAPLSHIALALIGEGEVVYQGRRLPSRDALAAARLTPVVLGSKEGVALINGTQIMTALGALSVYRGERLAKSADVIASMTLEALNGTDQAFDARIHDVRPHQGQRRSAANLRRLTEGSEIVVSHRGCPKVQDAYSLRCIPQVHGASRDAIAYARGVVETEANSATDNPLIFSDRDQVLSGGNFHGQPVALAMDFLGIALAELANISERRIERTVNPHLSGLPPFLTPKGGLNSGFMIAQYTAAALVSENKVLAHPASVDSIPTSANQEDHVSMGMIGARKAADILRNLRYVLAIELLCAAQALDYRGPLRPGRGSQAARLALRERVQPLSGDRIIHQDIETAAELIASGDLLARVEAEVGPLE